MGVVLFGLSQLQTCYGIFPSLIEGCRNNLRPLRNFLIPILWRTVRTIVAWFVRTAKASKGSEQDQLFDLSQSVKKDGKEKGWIQITLLSL